MSWRRLPLAVLLLLAIMLLTSCNKWRETYEHDEDIPYGLDLLPGVLQTRFAGSEYQEVDVDWLLDEAHHTDGNQLLYLAIAPGLAYTKDEARELLDIAQQGGHVLLAAHELANAVLDTFGLDSCLHHAELTAYFSTSEAVKLQSARGDTMTFPLRTEYSESWLAGRYPRRTEACLPTAVDLLATTVDGYASDSTYTPWMIRFKHGRGTIDLLTMPIVLTNIYVVDRQGQRIIEEVLSFYPQSPSKVVYDRERYSTAEAVELANRPPRPDPQHGPRSGPDDTLLAYVLTRPALATAWYTSLLGMLLFLIVGAKRRQRVVPLVQPRRNTTHDHLQNISLLYLSRPDNLLMVRKQLALFEAYCQRRFGLKPLRDEADRAKFLRLQGVKAADLDTALRYRNSSKRQEYVTDGGLVRLIRTLQNIYRGVGRRHD